MVILIYAQLSHSIYEAVRLDTGSIRRCGYFAWIEKVNVVCWFNSIFSLFASLNVQKTINFNCIYLETNFLGLVQLCIKASIYIERYLMFESFDHEPSVNHVLFRNKICAGFVTLIYNHGDLNCTILSNIRSLKFVDRCSETKIDQVVTEHWNWSRECFKS